MAKWFDKMDREEMSQRDRKRNKFSAKEQRREQRREKVQSQDQYMFGIDEE